MEKEEEDNRGEFIIMNEMKMKSLKLHKKLPICVSRGCLKLAITIFSSFTTIHVLKFFNFKMLYGT